MYVVKVLNVKCQKLSNVFRDRNVFYPYNEADKNTPAHVFLACDKKDFGFGFFLYTASPQQSDLRLSGHPSGRSAGGGSRTRDRRVPAELRADSRATDAPNQTENSFFKKI
ncbi:hypothetical protein PoB_002822000 [Plakobranchus ocellatus]|uniref:Uncharacterized protein n=1 Tax=Plakobranchus ocellatus TaxID=259542 RepID=A0AAV4A2X6_9GAST|nr:hypothetical protein PoB_002822000 [Plakobranchus ocellatus]